MSVRNSLTDEEKRNKVKQGFQSSLANVKDAMHDFESRDRKTETRGIKEGRSSKADIESGQGESVPFEIETTTVTEVTTHGNSQAMKIGKGAAKGAFKVALFVAKKHPAIAAADIARRQVVER